MKKIVSLITIAAAMTACNGGFDGVSVETVDRPAAAADTGAMHPLALEKLPLGAIKPEGWLRKQLELQRDGLNGHLAEISAWLDKSNNAWLVPGAHNGWEESPYWLRGYSRLGYILGDSAMAAETKAWIEPVLASQRPDGFFGPENMHNGHPEIWAQMVMLDCIQGYYEATGDERVLPFMRRYFEWEMNLPDEDFLEDYWENCRGGDNMWSVIWYYGHTGDASVLPLIEKIHRNNADCTNPAALPNWHNVNIAQYFREPAEASLVIGDSALMAATYNVHDIVRRTFGQVPGGMFGADENARIGYIDPRQGTETCGFAEQLASDGIMLSINADPLWAENMEDVAFNSFPASMTADLKALRYITAPNHAVSDSENHHPGIANRGPFLNMNPFSSRCCQHNHGLGWPAFTQSLAYATPDGGVAYAVYAPSTATLEVAGGRHVTISEDTRYPFSDTLRFEISTPEAATFPIYFRIPSWTHSATVAVDGNTLAYQPEPGKYMKLEREWTDGSKIELIFPMELSVRRWAVNQNSASVDYGPLTLSLKIDERYEKVDSKAKAIGDSHWIEGADPEKWPTYEIYADSPWNYALVLPDDNSTAGFEVVHMPWPADNQPFALAGVPLQVKAKGRLVPSWGIDSTGLTGVLPSPRAARSEQVDDITLVPMGAARLRISAFPTSNK